MRTRDNRANIKLPSGKIKIPSSSRGFPVSLLPVSKRAATFFGSLDIETLGDLHGYAWEQIFENYGIGRITIDELRDIVSRSADGEFRTNTPDPRFQPGSDFLPRFHQALRSLDPKSSNVLRMKFGGKPYKASHTLQEIGNRYGHSREYIRQTMANTIKQLKVALGPAMISQVQLWADVNNTEVRPFTPALFVKLFGRPKQNPPAFYIRIFQYLVPELVGWPGTRDIPLPSTKTSRSIAYEILLVLKKSGEKEQGQSIPLPIRTVNESLRQNPTFRRLSVAEFLDALRRTDAISLSTIDSQDKLDYSVASISPLFLAQQAVVSLLRTLERPVIIDELLQRVKESHFDVAGHLNLAALEKILAKSEDSILLGKRTFGTTRHLQLGPSQARRIANDIHRLLLSTGKPISLIYVIKSKALPWTSQVTYFEASHHLKQDPRFSYLGRFMFALHSWCVEERPRIIPLVIELLRTRGQPLHQSEIVAETSKLRSIPGSGFTSMLKGKPAIKAYGYGYYGLAEWDERRADCLFRTQDFLIQAIRETGLEPTFDELRRTLRVSTDNRKHQHLIWLTLNEMNLLKGSDADRKSPYPEALISPDWLLIPSHAPGYQESGPRGRRAINDLRLQYGESIRRFAHALFELRGENARRFAKEHGMRSEEIYATISVRRIYPRIRIALANHFKMTTDELFSIRREISASELKSRIKAIDPAYPISGVSDNTLLRAHYYYLQSIQ